MAGFPDPGTEHRAKKYYLGFFGLCAAELAVTLLFIPKITAFFESGPEYLFFIAIFGYMILSIGFAAGILWCLYQSRLIQKETGKTRWSI